MLVAAPLCVRVRLGHAPWKTGVRADSGRRFTVLTSPAGGTDVVAIRSLVSFTSLLPTTQAVEHTFLRARLFYFYWESAG